MMTFQPDAPFPKGAGDTIRSKDWNDLVQEVQRLRTEVDRLKRPTRGWMRIPFLPYFPPDSTLRVKTPGQQSDRALIEVFSSREREDMLIALPVPPGASRIHQLRMAGGLQDTSEGILNVSLRRTLIGTDQNPRTTPLLDREIRAEPGSLGVFDQRIPISDGELDAETAALTLVVNFRTRRQVIRTLTMNLIAAEFEYGERA